MLDCKKDILSCHEEVRVLARRIVYVMKRSVCLQKKIAYIRKRSVYRPLPNIICKKDTL